MQIRQKNDARGISRRDQYFGSFLSRVERGNAHLNLRRLTQIAEVLKVSPGYLLTGSNTTSKDYLKEDFKNILDKCSPEQQKLIYEISELVSKTKFESVNN